MLKQLLALVVMCVALSAQAGTLWSLNFEGSGGYTPSIAEFSDGADDYFCRADDNSGNPDGYDVSDSYLDDIDGLSVTGFQGAHYFAAQDIDGEGAILPVSLNVTGIDINGYSGLSFSGMFAEDDSGVGVYENAGDYLHITYSIDAGPAQNLLWLEQGADDYLYDDTDFDDAGDGAQITNVFQTLTKPIAATGSTMDLTIEFSFNAGDEDIALDNLIITAIPEPASITLLTLALALATRRSRQSVGV